MKLIFTSDIHSYLFATTFSSPKESNIGHYRIIESYKKDEDTLVIDGGDNIQGSALSKYVMEKKLFHPFPQASAFCEGGLDIAVPGNHDFNYGRDIFTLFYKETKATILCANLIDKRGELDIKKHLVFRDSEGLRVGLTGVVTDFVNVWEKKENLEDLVITDVKEAAQRELEWLKRNSDYTVLIYHGGFERDLKSGALLSSTRENIGYELCRDLEYDLLLSGHQHVGFDFQKVENTYILQPPSFARMYGEIILTKSTIEGKLKEPDGTSKTLEEKNKALRDDIERWLDLPCGEISEAIDAPSLIDSMLLGNHIADFFNYVQKEATGADISITALNNELFSFSKNVTIREILSSYQYPNSLYLIEVGERELLEALETTASFFILANGIPTISEKYLYPKMELYNYDYYYGIEYEFDLSKNEGERVTKLLYNGERIGEKKLSLVINNYRLTGAGGYSVYPKCKVIKSFDKDVQDLSIDYLLSHKNEPLAWPKALFKTIGY